MRHRRFPLLLIGSVCLMILGMALAWTLRRGLSTPATAPYIWKDRQADLWVHLFLLFSAALGIRAILPSKDEEE